MPRVHINTVEPVLSGLKHTAAGRERAATLLPSAEAFSHRDAAFLSTPTETTNPLIAAVTVAFSQHRPVELSPDVVYNVIMQGVSAHVATDPERFRTFLVKHQGEETITVEDDSLILGRWENDWSKSIVAIRDQIIQRLPHGKGTAALGLSFSTTGPPECVAHSAVLMDIMKDYYTYRVMTLCGIPWVDITGSREDWEGLANNLNETLTVLGLGDWNANLQEILTQVLRVYDSDADSAFWNSMFLYHGASESGGVARVTGWLAKLFLYIQYGKNRTATSRSEAHSFANEEPIMWPRSVPPTPANSPAVSRSSTPWTDESFWESIREQGSVASPFAGGRETESPLQGSTYTPVAPGAEEEEEKGIPLADFPLGLTETPFIWIYWGQEIPMRLRAGLVGVTARSDGVLRPEVGWVLGRA